MGSYFLSLLSKRKRSTSCTVTKMADPSPYSADGSSKRSKSKPTPPPLSVPPGHVAFRMLCHASRIGGVIGKSGAVIKNLQQVTGAKIRVEEAPTDSPDRVVVIIAPATISCKVFLGKPAELNGYCGGDGDGVEVSKAQEALLKVFERVLEVAGETDGIDARDGLVSCRLLVDTARVGSVIGKGGRVVEKIRKDTGCKIRALREWVLDNTSSSDEVIEIEGKVSSVKKALAAVSYRLQGCPSADRTKMTDSKPHEVVQHETSLVVPHEALAELHVDSHLQRNSALSTVFMSSDSYASGVHSLSADFNRVSSLGPKALHQEVTFRILCSNDRVGAVIGKGGSIIKALRNESGANITVGPSVAECEDRVVTVTASENPESRYSPAQKAVVLVFSRSIEAGIQNGLDPGSNLGSSVTARIMVPSNQVGCLLGKGGAIVSEMRKATGASIRIIGTDQVPKCASVNDQVVQISGEFSNVQDALYNATSRLRDNLFASTQNSGGTRNISSVLQEASPYGRLVDSVRLGAQPSIGISHTTTKHALSQSIDHLGYSQNLDHPSSPGRWTPQTVSSGINDVGRRLTSLKGGLELGSGSKTAIVTNTTVEIIVPDDVIGSVYGENGGNLARLRQISGAMVTIQEPRPGTGDRTVVISGTPDETRAAQSLLQAFILTGSS